MTAIEPLAYTVQEATRAVAGVSEDLILQAIRAGKLKAKRNHPKGRILIMRADLAAWLDALEDAS